MGTSKYCDRIARMEPNDSDMPVSTRCRKRSTLEHAFETYWQQLAPLDAPAYVAEYRFAPPRRWRFDVAWPDLLLAVELEGGIWRGGRHTTGRGYEADCEKYNAATMAGWRLLRFTSGMLHRDPVSCIGLVVGLLEAALIPC